MRHAKNNQRLSLPSEHRQLMVHNLVKSLLEHGQIRTTYARARVAQQVADRLVSWGKDGSIHARRRAYRVLQNRTLVRQLFSDVAPRFVDISGGYTRVLRLGGVRPGDGAQLAVLAFSRLPAAQPAASPGTKPSHAPQGPTAPQPTKPQKTEEGEKAKGFFEGLRTLWTRKKKGSTQ